MPHIKAKGHYRMSHNFRWVAGVHIGEIDISLGTKMEKEAILIEDAIIGLGSLERADLLMELKARRRKPAELYRLMKNQGAKKAKAIENHENLNAELEKWLLVARKANGKLLAGLTVVGYRATMGYMMKHCGTDDSLVSDLPSILKCFQSYCLDRDEPMNRQFNHARTASHAFARGTQVAGRNSELYSTLNQLASASTKRKRERVGLLPWQVRAILKKLDARWRDTAYLQVMTGARSKELNLMTIQDDRIIIRGTKTDGANRVVPRLGDFVIRRVAKDYKNYNAALKKASDGLITNYDLRACYRLWLAEAGIDPMRIRRYCGWHTGDKTNMVEFGYTSGDINNFLRADTELLVKYLEANWEAPKKDNTPMPKFIPTF